MTALENLRNYLAGLTADELRVHLDARPDVLRGTPLRDVEDLAERLLGRAGMAAALRSASWPELQVLELLAASGAGASEPRAVELLDPAHAGGEGAAHALAVGRVVATLQARSLIWPVGAHLEVNPGTRASLVYPLGLGRSVAGMLSDLTATELARVVSSWGIKVGSNKLALANAIEVGLGDPAHVRRVVATAPIEVVEHLITQARRAAQRAGASFADPMPADDSYREQPRTTAEYRTAQAAAGWAREHGMAFVDRSNYVSGLEYPCEVMLALVPAGTAFHFDPREPPLPTAAVTADQVTSSAAGALTMQLSATMSTLESLARVPLRGLKNGGIGVREMTALAKRLGVDAPDIRLTLEIAYVLGLLEQDSSGKLRTSPLFDTWRALPPAHRAADLIAGWLGLEGTPTLDRDDEDRAIPVLTDDGYDPHVRARRLAVLSALNAGEAGTGLVSSKALVQRLGWRTPLALPGLSQENVAHLWTEAEHLGVAAHGALSAVGRATIERNPSALYAALTLALPAVQRTALFGSDLTVVVPGSPDAAVVDLLDATAVREARGAASTWRITPASVRGAMDDGFDPNDLLDRLRALADGTLPQALEYLVHDVGRRYGAVLVQPSNAVLVGDEALLAEIEVHRALQKFWLRRVAPTVLVAIAPPGVVVDALRGAGYLPRHLDEDGTQVVRVGAKLPGAVRVIVDRAAHRASDDTTEAGLDDDFFDALDDDDTFDHLLTEGVEQSDVVAQRLVAGVAPTGSPSVNLEYAVALEAKQVSPAEVQRLVRAIANGKAVTIDYRTPSGGRTVQVLSNLKFVSPYVSGWSEQQKASRTFALANVFAVTPA